MEDHNPTFGELIRRHRLAVALSQEVLAERAGISPDTVRALERGRHVVPQPDTLVRLAQVLRLGVADRTTFMAAALALRSASPSPEAPGAAPAPAPLRRHSLPAAASTFVGRARELARMAELVQQTRLLTLTGGRGVGKSRLALAAAVSLVDAYSDGVWLLELAPLENGELVPGVLATLLGLREEPGKPILQTLTDCFRGRNLLLIMDNCEHLLSACAGLAGALLAAVPGLRILATSRECLGLAGEQLYRVPPLPAPDPQRLATAGAAGRFEAVQLFVTRVERRRANFTLTAANVQAVARICALVEGVPLALELAAARASTQPIEAIAAQLDDHFRQCSQVPHDLPSCPRALWSTLGWRWALLATGEQALLARLAVFAGGWTLPAAQFVCVWEQPVAHVSLDDLHGLVGEALAQVDTTRAETSRYWLEETVCQYAVEHLAEAGELVTARDRHLAWYVALAEEADAGLRGLEPVVWLNRLDTELANLRAALGWARERGATGEGLRLAAALWGFWDAREYFSEGLIWLEGALAGGENIILPARARALCRAGNLSLRAGRPERAGVLLREGLVLSRDIGAVDVLCEGLDNIAEVAAVQWQSYRAALLFGAAEALREQLGAPQQPAERAYHAVLMDDVRADLGEEVFILAQAAGRELPLDAALALALDAPCSPDA